MTYSSSWQILEEYDDGSLRTRYVYSPIYVDALLLRDRDVDANGSLEERIFALQDANYNIIALTDSTGTVIDRMEYKPFGEVTILNDNVDWKHYYQGGRADETTGQISFRFRLGSGGGRCGYGQRLIHVAERGTILGQLRIKSASPRRRKM